MYFVFLPESQAVKFAVKLPSRQKLRI